MMTRNTLLPIFYLVLVSAGASAQTQTWFRQLTTDTNTTLAVASDSSGVYACDNDTFRKLDQAGQLLWEKPALSCRGLETDGTSVYLLGSRRVGQTFDFQVVLTRYDRDGNLIWEQRVDSTAGFNIPSDMHVTPQGIFVSWYSSGATPFAARVDTAGNIQWSRAAGPALALALGIRAFDGTVYIGGQAVTGNPNNPQDIYILRLDLSGNALSTVFHGVDASDFFNDMEVNATGIYISGSTQTATGFFGRAFAQRFGFNGTLVWDRDFQVPGTARTIPAHLALADDRVLIGAITQANVSLPGLLHGALLSVDYGGTLQSVVQVEPNINEQIQTMILADRMIIIGGSSRTVAPVVSGAYVARFDLPPAAGPGNISGVIDTIGLSNGRANSYSNRVGNICQQLKNLVDTVRSDLASGNITLAQSDALMIALDDARVAIGCR